MRPHTLNFTLVVLRLSLVMLAFLGATLIPNSRVLGGTITTETVTVVNGTVNQATITKTATGQATITPPGGPPMTVNMPPGGGRIEAPGGDMAAFAAATVNLNTERKSHAWGYLSNSGFTASASADIHPMMTVTAVTFSQIIRTITISKDPNETICGFLGPGVSGGINYHTSLTDNNSGAVLFDSTTSLTNSSPDVVHDSTGMLTWRRTPGFFDGDEGDLHGLPNEFSNNLWVLDPYSLTFNTPVTLNPGDIYMNNFTDLVESSGFVTAVSPSDSGGVIGISSGTIPEPSSLELAGMGGLVLAGYAAARTWRRSRSPILTN